MPPFFKSSKLMATKIHQTGAREAWTFKHDDHADTVLIIPTGTAGQWYVIREHGHQSVNPCAVMTAAEIFNVYGFQVDAWEHPAKVI